MSLTQKVLWMHSPEGRRYQEIKSQIEDVSWKHLPMLQKDFLRKHKDIDQFIQQKLSMAWKEKIAKKQYLSFLPTKKLQSLSNYYASPRLRSLADMYTATSSIVTGRRLLVVALAVSLGLLTAQYVVSYQQDQQEFHAFQEYRQMPKK